MGAFMKEKNFLFLLEHEALQQAKLEEFTVLPVRLNRFARFFALHTWKILSIFSVLCALFSTAYEILY